MLHLPLLRHGTPYRSLDAARAVHHRTGETIAEVSQANVGLVRRELRDQAGARKALGRCSTRELIEMSARAGDLFLHGTLPCGEEAQDPQTYIEQLAATTGMPWSLARRNMDRIHAMFTNMGTVLAGLTRGLDLQVLDDGFLPGERPMSFYPRAQALGIVLPNNSPGVHSLWIPAVALKMPLVLKPGSAEPWTPYRIIQAYLAAGCPPEAFCFFPTDHAGASEILRSCGRGMLFGDAGAVEGWARDPRVELHGPGYSKVALGEDEADNWPRYIDLMAKSIADNGGRSCVNASGVWTPRHGDEIARALAERLAAIEPRPADDPEAGLAPFVNAEVARRIDATIELGLAEPGAEDVSLRVRGTPRLREFEGCTYLAPTVVRCGRGHALANREFLFPYASVVEVAEEEMPAALGPTLALTALTRNEGLLRRMLESPQVGRLNAGAIQTNAIRWDQPHEGNLFEHLYGRRAFEMAELAAR